MNHGNEVISLGSGDIASSSQERCKFGWLSKLIACICIMEIELSKLLEAMRKLQCMCALSHKKVHNVQDALHDYDVCICCINISYCESINVCVSCVCVF